jgi:hypothetical protein
MTTVDVMTGTITPPGATITHGTQFEWTCASAAPGTPITVIAQIMPNGNPWFTPSPTPSFTTPANSAPVTAQASGQWNWTATGVNIPGNPHIIIHLPGLARHERKAS